MSERVCQFFLRGRCQRAKCEFRHPADRAPNAAAAATTSPADATAASEAAPEVGSEAGAQVEQVACD
jgi:hypothetical protein